MAVSRRSVGPTQAEILMADRGDKNSANKKKPLGGGGREGRGNREAGGRQRRFFFSSRGCIVCVFSLMEKYIWLGLTGGHLVEFGLV